MMNGNKRAEQRGSNFNTFVIKLARKAESVQRSREDPITRWPFASTPEYFIHIYRVSLSGRFMNRSKWNMSSANCTYLNAQLIFINFPNSAKPTPS